MSETTTEKRRFRRLRHRGRGSQVIIYLGKLIRFFINQNDWKVLPMAAIIAALVSMVIRKKFFITMEGSLMGAFALTCVAIWNGCFNSIQAVCRERPIIKREHRSGMHISAYICAHMIYQFFLCLAQTGLTLYVMTLMGVNIPREGFITPYMIVDLGITLLLIAYASDMLSLFISSISHTTTGAMTVMPFVLIFQLVFSGGLIPLPEWSRAMSNYTISNYGIRAISAQSGYNERPMVTAWDILVKMKDKELGGSMTLGQLMDLLDSPAVEKHRDMVIMRSVTVGEAADVLSSAESSLHLRDHALTQPFTLRQVLEFFLNDDALAEYRQQEFLPATENQPAMTFGDLAQGLLAEEDLKPMLDQELGMTITLGQVLDALHVDQIVEHTKDVALNEPVTLGDIVDFLKNNETLNQRRDDVFTFKITIGDIFDLFGEETVKDTLQRRTAEASFKPEYAMTEDNIYDNWAMLGVFIAAFALLATLALELIDKDKR